jgi:hypothetical protein
MGKRQNDVPENAARPNPSACGKQPDHEASSFTFAMVARMDWSEWHNATECSGSYPIKADALVYRSSCNAMPYFSASIVFISAVVAVVLMMMMITMARWCTLKNNRILLGIFLWNLSIVVLIINPKRYKREGGPTFRARGCSILLYLFVVSACRHGALGAAIQNR